MIPGYDFYAEEEDPSPYRWEVKIGHHTQITWAGPFANDEHAAIELRKRRKAFPGYTVKLLKDGQVWEPVG